MKSYVDYIDRCPWILKLIFALPGIDGIVYGLYRLFKGQIIAGIIWLVCGWAILWIIDVICVVLHGKVDFFA